MPPWRRGSAVASQLPPCRLRGLYRPLGRGDVDLVTVITALEEAGYDGWYVLEQDTVLSAEPEPGSGPGGGRVREYAVAGGPFSTTVSPGSTGRDKGSQQTV